MRIAVKLDLFLAIIAGSLLMGSGLVSAGNRCEKIVDEFVINNLTIMRDYPDPSERLEQYKRALRDLIKEARGIYGPFCPCDEFLNRAAALQSHRETWRSPPPGWNPKKFDDNFRALEIESARKDVKLLMDLMGLCDGS